MYKTDGYDFAKAIQRLLEAINKAEENHEFTTAYVSFSSAATIALGTNNEQTRMNDRIRGDYRRKIKDSIENVAQVPASQVKKESKPVSLLETICWLVDSFFAAPGDAERKLVIQNAQRLSVDEKRQWYVI